MSANVPECSEMTFRLSTSHNDALVKETFDTRRRGDVVAQMISISGFSGSVFLGCLL